MGEGLIAAVVSMLGALLGQARLQSRPDRAAKRVGTTRDLITSLEAIEGTAGARERLASLLDEQVDYLDRVERQQMERRYDPSQPVIAALFGVPLAYGSYSLWDLSDWYWRLAQHLERAEPLAGERLEAPATGGLITYSRERKPLNRNYFNQAVRRPTLREVGISNERDNGMHALRHACASLWLEHGVSIKAVSEYLGHADPGSTLRVYTHVMPSSGDKARKAMDTALGRGGAPTHAGAGAGAPWAHETVTESGQ